jgi:hydroxymethylpyrimidine pyrophosphatase-like HAD family hydrolase
MYRLLALDLDGTLLRYDDRKTIDERDVAAIAELQRAGVTVTIATGRLYSGSIAAARACAIEGAIACVEGSHLVEAASAKTLAHHAMPMTDHLREVFGGRELASFVFGRDGIHHDADGEPYAGYVSTWSPNMRVVEEALHAAVWQGDPLAAVAIGEPDAIADAHAAIRDHATLFTVTFAIHQCPGKHALMVRAAGISKGTALLALCEVAGCTAAEAVVVGDWFNDVPMFEVAGRSFVMGGAPPHVAAKATDVLVRPAGHGGGIAEAIRRAWG